MFRRLILAAFIISALSMYSGAQELHRTGLLFEDLTKVEFIKEYKTLSKISTLPKSVDLSSFMPPVGNQGTQGSCTAWSLGYYTKTYQEYIERGWSLSDESHRFSPAFIYNQINGGVDSGSYFSDAVFLMMRSGCSVISEQPYLQGNCTSLPSATAMENAIKYRVSMGYYVNTSVESGKKQLKELLAEGKVATLGISVYPNFDNISLYNYVYCSGTRSGQNRGGHAITIVGYDDSLKTFDGYGAFKFVNSWGTNWGRQGYGWISYKAISDPFLSQQVAIFVTDRINYTPLLKAKVNLPHKSRGSVELKFMSRLNQTLISSLDISFPVVSVADLEIPDQILTYDLTDFLNYMSSGAAYGLTLQVVDIRPDGNSTSINSFTLEEAASGSIVTCTETPKAVPDRGGSTVALSFVPQFQFAGIRLKSPMNGLVEVSDTPVLSWEPSGSALYSIQVSTNDINFEDHIVFSNTTNVTSIQIPELQRNKVYFWRVADNAKNNWSEIWSFKTLLLNKRIGFTPEKTTYNWMDISTTGTSITNWINVDNNNVIWTAAQKSAVKDDGYTAEKIPIGFEFDFYGKKYDSLYVGVNGLVSFDQQMLNTASIGGFTGEPNYLGAFSNEFYPPEGSYYSNSIAAAYNDFDLDKSDGYGWGRVLYQTLNDQFVLSWENIGTFEALKDTLNSFQLVLDKNDKSITINYKSFGKAATVNGLKTGIQQCDTAGVMWYASGVPIENKPGNNTSVKFKPVSTSGINDHQIPETFLLLRNYPNPFNPVTSISFNVPQNEMVNLKIFDLLGREITTLVNGYLSPGEYKYQWNAAEVPSGIYLCKLTAGKESSVTKMLLLK